jgi:hypothetical protein
MATVKAVNEPEADPKIGRPKAKSGVSFPYYDLEDAVSVARAIQEKAGGVCDQPQLAALLGHRGINSGAFLSRVSGAKMFGLIEQADDQKLRVTPRGLAVVAPIVEGSAGRAKVEAFLAVDLFKKVFDQFNGQTLPAEVGLRNLLETTYQVVPARVVPTVRVMLDSADYAGMFQPPGSRTRMVMPLSLPTPATQHPPAPPAHEPPAPRNGGGGDGGDGGDRRNIPRAILGLLEGLPPAGTALGKRRRDALVAAFTATVGFIYPDAEGNES